MIIGFEDSRSLDVEPCPRRNFFVEMRNSCFLPTPLCPNNWQTNKSISLAGEVEWILGFAQQLEKQWEPQWASQAGSTKIDRKTTGCEILAFWNVSGISVSWFLNLVLNFSSANRTIREICFSMDVLLPLLGSLWAKEAVQFCNCEPPFLLVSTLSSTNCRPQFY